MMSFFPIRTRWVYNVKGKLTETQTHFVGTHSRVSPGITLTTGEINQFVKIKLV